jgi:hypothetical protein
MVEQYNTVANASFPFKDKTTAQGQLNNYNTSETEILQKKKITRVKPASNDRTMVGKCDTVVIVSHLFI